VPVERPSKTAALEFTCIIVEVVTREPIRQWIGISQALEVFRVRRLPGSWSSLQAFARGPIVDLPQRSAHVDLELCLGDTRLLEIDLIEEAILVDVSKQLDARGRTPSGIGDAQTGDRANLFRKKQRCIPDNGRAPIVADENGL